MGALPMKWEYLVVSPERRELNQLEAWPCREGEEGWELVVLDATRAVFKRLKRAS